MWLATPLYSCNNNITLKIAVTRPKHVGENTVVKYFIIFEVHLLVLYINIYYRSSLFWGVTQLKLVLIDRRSDCHETSVNKYKSTSRNVPEGQIPHLNRSGTTQIYLRCTCTLCSNYVTYACCHNASSPKVDVGLRILKVNWLIMHTWQTVRHSAL